MLSIPVWAASLFAAQRAQPNLLPFVPGLRCYRIYRLLKAPFITAIRLGSYDFNSNAKQIQNRLSDLMSGQVSADIESNVCNKHIEAEDMQIPGSAASGSILLDFLKKQKMRR
jgi:hypothetical protein